MTPPSPPSSSANWKPDSSWAAADVRTVSSWQSTFDDHFDKTSSVDRTVLPVPNQPGRGGGNGSGLPHTELIDTSKLPPNGSPIVEEVVDPAVKGACIEDAHTMCLNNGRFRVHAIYGNSQEVAKQWPLTSDSGYSTFFSDSNVELFIKVLDACGLSGNHWVFASGLTDVKVELYVEDTQTGKVWHASNPQGRVFATILDTDTFLTDCD